MLANKSITNETSMEEKIYNGTTLETFLIEIIFSEHQRIHKRNILKASMCKKVYLLGV